MDENLIPDFKHETWQKSAQVSWAEHERFFVHLFLKWKHIVRTEKYVWVGSPFIFLLKPWLLLKKTTQKEIWKNVRFFDHENPKMGFLSFHPQKKNEIQRHVAGFFFFVGDHPLPVGQFPFTWWLRIKESTPKMPKKYQA